MLQRHYMHVASLCFMCFRHLFQMFHLDISKVDLGVAHVSMATHSCFKRMFQVFHLYQIYVVNVSSGYFKSIS
jgi:hypothetical protein